MNYYEWWERVIPEKDNSVEKRVPKERSPAMINMKQVVRT